MSFSSFQTFADDSYDGEYYVVGGFLAPTEVWQEATPRWFSTLKELPRLGYYTTNDALGLKGPFKEWTPEIRNGRMAKLASVIPTENCWGVAAHLRRSDFEIFAKTFPSWDDPYYLCADHLVLNVAKFLKLNQPSVTVADFIFDRQGKIGKTYKLHYDKAIKPSVLSVYPFLGECRHENKEEFIPLQAADMNAAWVRRRSTTIQLWTTADPYLSNFEQLDFRVSRPWLEQMAKYHKEHEDEIKEYWDRRLGPEK
jgi:hypothetical protein